MYSDDISNKSPNCVPVRLLHGTEGTFDVSQGHMVGAVSIPNVIESDMHKFFKQPFPFLSVDQLAEKDQASYNKNILKLRWTQVTRQRIITAIWNGSPVLENAFEGIWGILRPFRSRGFDGDSRMSLVDDIELLLLLLLDPARRLSFHRRTGSCQQIISE
jgi:hypothetical protein